MASRCLIGQSKQRHNCFSHVPGREAQSLKILERNMIVAWRMSRVKAEPGWVAQLFSLVLIWGLREEHEWKMGFILNI